MPNNIRISLKIDTLENWNNSDLILQNGEVAFIQMPNGTTKIKIGDGINVVKQLSFINEIEFFTKELSTQQLNIGIQNKTTTYSSVIGQHLSANSSNSTIFGFNAETLNTDQFSFVWNGKNLYGYNNRYKSHGAGTFSLNPENGISGIYIGEDTLASMLNTIYINGEKTNDFQVINIAQDDYHALVKDGTTLSNAIYIVSSDEMNMYNERIINVADAISGNDAVNLNQLSNVQQSLKASIDNKVYIDGEQSESISVDTLNIIKLSRDDYYQLSIQNKLCSDYIYVTSFDELNMYGQKITNVGTPIHSSDVVNLSTLNKIVNDVSTITHNKLNDKIYIDGISAESLSVENVTFVNLTRDEYIELKNTGNLCSNYMYITEFDQLNMHNQKIVGLKDGVDDNDAATYGQLSVVENKVETLIHDIQIIKPVYNGKLHLQLTAYINQEMTDVVITFDSLTDQKYFAAFLNTADEQKWNQIETDGFGAEFNNCPVLIKLTDILTDNNQANKYSKLFICYEWYNLGDDGIKHISDRYSIVVPSHTEVGANSNDYIVKSQFEDLASNVRKDSYVVTLEDDKYRCYPYKTNIINDSLTGIVPLILDDFQINKQYDIWFSTGESKTILEFYYENEINGIEIDDSWNINKNYKFEPNKSYLIKVRQDLIEVVEDKYDGSSSSGNHSYKLVTAELSGTTSLTCNIEDRTITTVVVSDSEIPITVNFPQKIDGYARDFILRIEVTSSEAPEFTFTGLDDSWSVDAEDDEWMFMQPGTNIISFTEMK